MRLVLVLAGLLLAVGIYALRSGPDPDEGSLDPGVEAPDPGPTPGPQIDEENGLRTEGRIQVTDPVDLRAYTKSFDGTGTIMGSIEVRPKSLPFPDTWELVIEPSRMSIGRDEAGTRVVQMDGNQTTFEERDLPLGGYRVTARAEGYNATVHEVLLYLLVEAPNSGQTAKNLVMHFQPAGALRGSVVDPDGLAAEGVPVTVGELSGTRRWTTATDITGWWRVAGLVDGRYRVWLGPPTKPLVPEFEVALVGDEVTAPEQRLPPTGSVVLWVTDEEGRPLEEVRVRGYGPAPIDVVTGFEGRVLVPFLPAGQYHVEVEPGPTEHTGRLTFTVKTTDREREIQITTQP